MKWRNKTIFLFISVIVFVGGISSLLSFSIIYPDFSKAARIYTETVSCSGFSSICNDSCKREDWGYEDTDYQIIHSAWKGAKFSWDDDASIVYGYDKVLPDKSEHQEFTSHSQDPENRGWVCNCGDAAGCPGTSYWTDAFFPLSVSNEPGKDSVFGKVYALQKRTKDMNPFRGEVDYGVSIELCDTDQRTEFSSNSAGKCVNVTGSISANPSSDTAPCSTTISWSSNAFKTKVYKNGVLWQSSDTNSGSKSDSDFTGGNTYTYRLEGTSGLKVWIFLGEVKFTCNSSPQNVSCSPSSQNASVNEEKTFTGSGGDGNYSWSGPSECSFLPSNTANPVNVSCSSSGLKTITVSSAGASDTCNLNVTSTPSACSGSISANPNPIKVCPPDTTGVTTLTASNVTCNFQIRVNSPTGTLMTSSSEPPGTRDYTTGDWTTDGMWFYLVEAGVSDGSYIDKVQVTHTNSRCPLVDLKANPSYVSNQGDNTTLTWTSLNTNSCTASSNPVGAWSGSKPLNNSTGESVPVNSNPTTFTLTCSDTDGNQASDSVSVSVSGGGDVYLYSISPSSLSFSAEQNGSLPSPQNILVVNKGNKNLNISVSDDSSWMSVSPTSFSLSPSASKNVSVSPTTTNLSPGSRYGKVFFSEPNAGDKSADVTYTINSPSAPSIYLSGDLTFTGSTSDFQSTPPSQILTIKNNGGVGTTLNWTASKDKTWCHLFMNSGAINSGGTQGVPVTVDSPASVGAGNHICTITVSDPSASNSPQTKQVTYTITSSVKPNLVITDFHLTDVNGNAKTTFSPGENIYPSVTIKNIGSSDATSRTGEWYISIYSNSPSAVTKETPSDVNVWVGENNTISIGESKTYSITENSSYWTDGIGGSNQNHWTMSSNGDFVARAFVDSFDYITEINETDNQTTSNYTLSSANSLPAADSLNVTQPDYCTVDFPAAIFSWHFSDSDGDSQSAYQVQVDNNSNFNSPEDDSGKVSSSSNSYATLPGNLKYKTTYHWRLKVWDSQGASSDWIYGPDFTTPKHAYPKIDFSWLPQKPSVNEEVQFIDESRVTEGVDKLKWSWTFPDGDPSSSPEANPKIKFLSAGIKAVTLEVTDSDGFTCPGTKNVTVGIPLPGWKEIPPFMKLPLEKFLTNNGLKNIFSFYNK